MHTTYHKISARERDAAPRFYYKRARSYTLCQRVRQVLRAFLAFLFTQVGEKATSFPKYNFGKKYFFYLNCILPK